MLDGHLDRRLAGEIAQPCASKGRNLAPRRVVYACVCCVWHAHAAGWGLQAALKIRMSPCTLGFGSSRPLSPSPLLAADIGAKESTHGAFASLAGATSAANAAADKGEKDKGDKEKEKEKDAKEREKELEREGKLLFIRCALFGGRVAGVQRACSRIAYGCCWWWRRAVQYCVGGLGPSPVSGLALPTPGPLYPALFSRRRCMYPFLRHPASPCPPGRLRRAR